VAESADALRSGRSVRRDVRVQIPPSAPSRSSRRRTRNDVWRHIDKATWGVRQDGRWGASTRGKSEQHRAGCPAKAGAVSHRDADSPKARARERPVRAREGPRESNRNGTGRLGGPDETGNPPCCNLRSGRTQPSWLLTVTRRDRKSRAAAKAMTRPALSWGGERWPSAQRCVNRTRLTRLTPLVHCGASSSIGRAPACGAGCYGFEPREAPHLFSPHNALVAQLDRASDFGSEGWGFKSLRAYHCFSLL
jgi:hypothetical protein